jgi:hypothetical protein
LSIAPPWRIPITDDKDFRDHPGHLLLGGKIEVRNCRFWFYSFALCIVTNNNIARRFHFDIDTGKGKAIKPKCHMQYGGEAKHELRYYPTLNYGLEEWMSTPRLPYPPLDIVILIDFLLRQINTPLSQKFAKEPNWTSLVRKSEKLRLKEYYNQIHGHLAHSNDNSRTLFEKLSG